MLVLSRPADTIWRLSPENATLNTSFAWPLKVHRVAPVVRSQRRMVLSQEPDRTNWPSEESTTHATGSL